MKALFAIEMVLCSSLSFAGTAPKPPSEATLATACRVPSSAVSRTVKLPDGDPKLKDRMIWLASYEFTKPVDFAITMACVVHGRFSEESFAFIASRPELEYKKLVLPDGSVIHHNLGDRGSDGTFYSTTLVTESGPYDYTLLISRKSGVEDADLPIDIKTSGIDLIQALVKQE